MRFCHREWRQGVLRCRIRSYFRDPFVDAGLSGYVRVCPCPRFRISIDSTFKAIGPTIYLMRSRYPDTSLPQRNLVKSIDFLARVTPCPEDAAGGNYSLVHRLGSHMGQNSITLTIQWIWHYTIYSVSRLTYNILVTLLLTRISIRTEAVLCRVKFS